MNCLLLSAAVLIAIRTSHVAPLRQGFEAQSSMFSVHWSPVQPAGHVQLKVLIPSYRRIVKLLNTDSVTKHNVLRLCICFYHTSSTITAARNGTVININGAILSHPSKATGTIVRPHGILENTYMYVHNDTIIIIMYEAQIGQSRPLPCRLH